MKIKYLLIFCSLLMVSQTSVAQEPPSESWTFTIRFEHDLFNITNLVLGSFEIKLGFSEK